ncbi:hypothetical protein [Rhizohabitans arisaemae]|uniref:hypothetical protein n=1 Tax=Rhizohabitans arisaemae TaxID=2720610 RepID=UPI0024B12C0B|nr:hypothetical protein [Rhizohabitans arisaemae]
MSLPLIEEAAKKSGVLWVGSRLAWHVWHDGAIYLVTGGAEQRLPGLATTPRTPVTLRSKDSGGALITFEAEVTVVAPGTKEWDAAVPVLAKERLNAPDTESMPARWAAESTVLKLRPTGT